MVNVVEMARVSVVGCWVGNRLPNRDRDNAPCSSIPHTLSLSIIFLHVDHNLLHRLPNVLVHDRSNTRLARAL